VAGPEDKYADQVEALAQRGERAGGRGGENAEQVEQHRQM
jgi:hypothetical protein